MKDPKLLTDEDLAELKRQMSPGILSGEIPLIDAPKPQYEDPHDSPEYQAFVEEMATHCRCQPCSARPCDGVLAGGLCDQIDWTKRDDFNDDEELFHP